MTVRRQLPESQFLVERSPTGSGSADSARRMTDAAFLLLPLWDAVESTIELPHSIDGQGPKYVQDTNPVLTRVGTSNDQTIQAGVHSAVS
jgi:hypothetical protein